MCLAATFSVLEWDFSQEIGILCEEAWENVAWNGVQYANILGRMLDQPGGTEAEL